MRRYNEAPTVKPADMCDVTDGRYNSIADFVTAASTKLRVKANAASVEELLRSPAAPYGSSWFGAGCKNGPDVLRKLKDGWPEGRERLAKLTAKLIKLEVNPMDRRRRRVRSDFGDSVDIHSIYRGQFDRAWEIPRRQFASGPQQVDILANMICSGGEESDVLFWRGAAAIVLADKLEAAGYMVRLTVGFGGSNNHGERTSCRVIVKDHDKPIDICSTASVLMPGFFRCVGHAWLAAHASYDLGRGNYGIRVQEGKAEENEIILSHDVRDAATAQQWLERTLVDFNDGAVIAA